MLSFKRVSLWKRNVNFSVWDAVFFPPHRPLFTLLCPSHRELEFSVFQTHFEHLQCAEHCLVHHLNTHAFLEMGQKTAAPDQCRGAGGRRGCRQCCPGASSVAQSCPTLCNLMDSKPPGCPVPGKNTEVDCHFLRTDGESPKRRRGWNQILVQREHNSM